ncbi:MAG: DEAD/DEAH box helicase [Bacilli bacterium]|nr:DEAD/DEAH box helicase [Bacilli bacterium]
MEELELKFEDLNVKESIKRAIADVGYIEMTPIQKAALPVVLEGRDIIAQAPTGTGKTCCFAIPGIDIVDVDNPDVQVLVLCPTRELAMQVSGEFQKLAKFTQGLRVCTVYGGQDIEKQIMALKRKPQIICGTPGRIMDHLRRRTIKIKKIKMLILDEADEMLNMGFREDLDVILENVKHPHQTVLFSATMPEGIKRITENYQKDAVTVKTTYKDTDLPEIDQYYVELAESNKIDCLSRMIDTYNFKQALVFCRTKRKVDELSFSLTSRGYQVECLHGDMKQTSRDKVMDMFRNGLIRILIATDVAARGLDINGIDAVFNYDIPDDIEYYVHRIGRTARAGRTGAAYSFVVKKELYRIKSFSRELKTSIVQIAPPSYAQAKDAKVKNILKELINSNKDTNLIEYLNYIYITLSDEGYPFEPEMIGAAFLKQLIDTDSRFKDAGLDLSVTKTKKSGTLDGYTRVFINLGRIDHLNKAELVDLITQNHLVESAKIMGIDIMNTYSFFEVPTNKVDSLLKFLNNRMYNGREINVEVSTGKKKTSSKKEEKTKRTTTKTKETKKEEKPKKENAKTRGTKDKFLTEHSKKKKSSDAPKKKETKEKKTSDKKTNKRLEIKW